MQSRHLPAFALYKRKAIKLLNDQFTNPKEATQVSTLLGIMTLLAIEVSYR
jgi:hypothetical protein